MTFERKILGNTLYPLKVQNWVCEECENDMSVVMFIRSPYEGILLECTECDREVGIENEQETILV